MSHRSHHDRRRERVDPREAQMIYEKCTKQEQEAVENLYKSKWGVNNLEIPKNALESLLGKLFSAKIWQDTELMETKVQLSDSKDKMDDIPIEIWRQLAKQVNRAQKLVVKLRQNDVELATMSWCSMYEALCRFMLFPRMMQTPEGPQLQQISGLKHSPDMALGNTEQPDRKVGATVHLCELPGAFVSAINHYQHTVLKYLDWDWQAISLSPYYTGNDQSEMIMDNALLVQTSTNWHFGKDESGDIRKKENIESFWEHCSEWFESRGVPGAMLVTADGSVDTQENPNEQEAVMASLLYAQFVTALGLLSVGGSFFLKAFALLEHSSITLLYACGSLFDKVDVYKPVASKVNNSEVYIVCRGFRGVSPNVRDALLRFVSRDVYESASMLPRSAMPESFYQSAKGCGKFFANRTREAIEDTLCKRSMHPGQAQAVKDIQEYCALTWVQKFRVIKLNPELRLSPDEFISGSQNRVGGQQQRDFAGTLKQRRMQYQDRRDVQGLETTRIIKRMREETGLENASAEEPPTQIRNKKKMRDGRKGKSKQQALEVQPASESQSLGSGTRFKSQFAIVPDTQRIENAENLDLDGAVVPPDSDEVQYAWEASILNAVPKNVLTSATIESQVFLELRRHRKRTSEQFVGRTSTDGATVQLCPHTGECRIPHGTPGYSPAFWKLAALDLQLAMQRNSFCRFQTTMSLFLRASCGNRPVRSLSLEAYQDGALKYLMMAHHSRSHEMQLHTVYCLGGDHIAELSSSMPNLIQCIRLPGEHDVSPQSTQDQKLAAFTVHSSKQVCKSASQVDVVIGDLGDLDADIPYLQQLSIWPEYNRVVRRRLVWEAATVLGACRAGGSALLRLGDVLTSFTVGLLYVLFRNFRLFAMVKPFTSCTASSESFVLLLDRAAQSTDDDEGESFDSTSHLLSVLEKMEEVEGLAPLTDEIERPHADLLVNSHVSDILKPEVYLGGDKQFELSKRQAAVLENLVNKHSNSECSLEAPEKNTQQAIKALFTVEGAELQPKVQEGIEGAQGCGYSDVELVPLQRGDSAGEGTPQGVRKKRSVNSGQENPGYQEKSKPAARKPKSNSEHPTPLHEGNTATCQSIQPLQTRSLDSNVLRSFHEKWGLRLCGVDVDRKNDCFIQWSQHIMDCDQQEQDSSDEG